MPENEVIEIVLDNDAPSVEISPGNGEVLNESSVLIQLEFNKEVNLLEVTLNEEDIMDSFVTVDNQIFTYDSELEDANYKLIVSGEDYATNEVVGYSSFAVNAEPLVISIIEPSFGVSVNYTFDLVIGTDNDAVCRYNIGNDYEFKVMDQFDETGSDEHRKDNFDLIPAGSKDTITLRVKCNDSMHGMESEVFSLRVDTEEPKIKEAFADPNPVVEEPSVTILTVQTDKKTKCRYSEDETDFQDMENKFPGFDDDLFGTVNKANVTAHSEGDYKYFVACMAENELMSAEREIQFTVNLSLPLVVTSNTPEFSNTTGIVLAVQTNKVAQCEYSPDDPKVNSGIIFGASGRSHTRSLTAGVGLNTYYIKCRDEYVGESDVLEVSVTVDTTAPVMDFVDDSSRLKNNTEFTWRINKLRVKWLAEDEDTRVSSYEYTLEEFATLDTVVNWTTSFRENDWLWVDDLSLTNSAKYFFRVRASNILGLTSEVEESDGITVDTSLKPSSCSNNMKDGSETDIDCGGPCDQCLPGKTCNENIDCISEYCDENGICAAATCDDGVKQGVNGETDIDCGGSNCEDCEDGKTCNENSDCASEFCSFGICKEANSCEDGRLSGSESDVDCGGACPTTCPQGKHCGVEDDCVGGLSCIKSVCKLCTSDDPDCGTVTPGDRDTDGDGLPDEWELEHGLDPNDPNDAFEDSDGDGIINIDEYTYNTDPNKADSDGDGYTDKEEIDKGTDPLDPKSKPKSRLGFLLFMIFLVVIVAAGGYFGYVYYTDKQFGKTTRARPGSFARPPQMLRQRPQPGPQRPKAAAQQPGLRSREEIKRREGDKRARRGKLFEIFDKKGKAQAETGKPAVKKEDVSTQLKSMPQKKPVKEKDSLKVETDKLPGEKKEDVMERLKQLSKKTKDKKSEKKDVFKELGKIATPKKPKKKRAARKKPKKK